MDGRRMWHLWGEGLTPSLQATGPEDLPSTGLAVGSSSRLLLEWGHPQLLGSGVKPQLCPLTGTRRVTPRRGPPEQSPAPLFWVSAENPVGVAQGKRFLGGTLMTGSDPTDRFLQWSGLRTEHLGVRFQKRTIFRISQQFRAEERSHFSAKKSSFHLENVNQMLPKSTSWKE